MSFGGRGGGRGGGGRGTFTRSCGSKRPYGDDRNSQGDFKRARFQADLNPTNITPVGTVSHTSENKLVCKVSLENQVPMFNQPVFLENKTHIGKSDEIFGQLNNVLMSVELVETIKPDSLDKRQTLYMDSNKLTPKERFLPRNPPDPLAPKVKRAPGQGGRGGGRGGFSRGGGRGGFQRGGARVYRGGFGQSNHREGYNQAGRGGYSQRGRGGYNNQAGGRGGFGGHRGSNGGGEGGGYSSRGGRGAGGRGGFRS